MSGIVKRLLPVFIMRVKGASMLPLFVCNQRVVVRKFLFQKPRVNDVVVVQHPNNNALLLKRIIAIQGKMYVVEGDNKQHSTDSRHFGAISKKHVIGKVITTL